MKTEVLLIVGIVVVIGLVFYLVKRARAEPIPPEPIPPTPPFPETDSISGYVYDALTHKPLGGALVQIAGKSQSTESSGRFYITRIASGTYTLSVSLEGYELLLKPVQMAAGDVVTLDIYLTPKQSPTGAISSWQGTIANVGNVAPQADTEFIKGAEAEVYKVQFFDATAYKWVDHTKRQPTPPPSSKVGQYIGLTGLAMNISPERRTINLRIVAEIFDPEGNVIKSGGSTQQVGYAGIISTGTNMVLVDKEGSYSGKVEVSEVV